MARKFRELDTRMSPEAVRASEEIYSRLKETMALDELRDALRMTQQKTCADPNVDQSAVRCGSSHPLNGSRALAFNGAPNDGGLVGSNFQVAGWLKC
jgi:hypothetical protein